MRYRKKSVRASVVAVVKDSEGRVLLTRRAVPPYLGQWVMPGGKIDPGEPITAALKREVLEEVGIDVHVEGLVDVFEVVNSGEHDNHYVILYYLATAKGGTVLPNAREISEVLWVDRKSVEGLDIPDGTRHILSKIFTEPA